MKTRIAPTPSGFLHIGNAFSFLLTEEIALKHYGKILLRIDDLDAERKRPEYVQDIFESLSWLGIAYQEGPEDSTDFESNWSQLRRLDIYHAAISKLIASGLAFACSCSRKELQEKGGCDCREKNIPHDTPDTALRIFVPAGKTITVNENLSVPLFESTGHFIIRRRDGIPAYQLASLCDDLHFGITHIVRGTDLLSSTAAQLYLAEILGEDRFASIRFYHHPLLKNDQDEKLSKSAGALSLKAMRESGTSAAEIRERFHQWRLQIPAFD